MNYTVTINENIYDLPTLTAEMNKTISRIEDLESLVRRGDVSIVDADRERYDFVIRCVSESLPPLEEIDMNDLFLYCMKIIQAYKAPVIKARTEEAVEMLRGVLNRPEVQKLVLLTEAAQKKKK